GWRVKLRSCKWVEVNHVAMDSVQLMDARGSIVSFFPSVGRRRRHTRRDSSQDQPLAAGGATGRSGEGSEKREDGRVVRADEPRGSAPIHRRFRSRVSLPQGRGINLRPAELVESYFDGAPRRQIQL